MANMHLSQSKINKIIRIHKLTPKCFYCGSDEKLTKEHISTLARKILVFACLRCNEGRSLTFDVYNHYLKLYLYEKTLSNSCVSKLDRIIPRIKKAITDKFEQDIIVNEYLYLRSLIEEKVSTNAK